MLLFAKIITILFSFLYILGIVVPYWIDIPFWILIIYELIVTGLFFLIVYVVSRFARKNNKSVFWFRYLDSLYSKKFQNKQYIDTIGLINTIYDEKSQFLSVVEKEELLERKKSLDISIESGKLTPIKLIPIIASTILSYFLPVIQNAISPAFDADRFLTKLEEMLVSNTDINVILKTVKEMIPAITTQDNWNFTACIITIFVLMSVEIVVIKAPNLCSECMEYEIEKIESVIQKDKSDKNNDTISLECAYTYLEDYSKTENKKTGKINNIKDFYSDFDALDKKDKEKLTEVMKEKRLYKIIFNKD